MKVWETQKKKEKTQWSEVQKHRENAAETRIGSVLGRAGKKGQWKKKGRCVGYSRNRVTHEGDQKLPFQRVEQKQFRSGGVAHLKKP